MKRLAGKVFAVTGLLADEDETSVARAFAKDEVCGVAVERAGAAFLRRMAEGGEAVRLGNGCRRVLGEDGAHTLINHRFHTPGSACQEVGNHRCPREISPVFARHLGEHGFFLHAGRIENVRVVREP